MIFHHVLLHLTALLVLFTVFVSCADDGNRRPRFSLPPGVSPHEFLPVSPRLVAGAETFQPSQLTPSGQPSRPARPDALPFTSHARPAGFPSPQMLLIDSSAPGSSRAIHPAAGTATDPGVRNWFIDEDDDPWDKVDTGRSRPGTRSQFVLRQVTLLDGRKFGPYDIGNPKMQLKKYPLDIPFFKHSYERDGLRLVDFEEFVEGSHFPLQHKDFKFRPEPHIMAAIHDTIAGPLQQTGLSAARINPEADILEGEYLWPNVRMSGHRNLGMNLQYLRSRVSRSMFDAFAFHGNPAPTLFHLTVPTGHGDRHVLMAPGEWADHTEVRNAAHRSGLWLFYEGMEGREGERRMALLGAMGLPDGAHQLLRQAGKLTTAFPNAGMISHVLLPYRNADLYNIFGTV